MKKDSDFFVGIRRRMLRSGHSAAASFRRVGVLTAALLLVLVVASFASLWTMRAQAREALSQDVARLRTAQSALASFYLARIAEETFLSEATREARRLHERAMQDVTQDLDRVQGMVSRDQESEVVAIREKLDRYESLFVQRAQIISGEAQLNNPDEFRTASSKEALEFQGAETLMRQWVSRWVRATEDKLAATETGVSETTLLVVLTLVVGLVGLMALFRIGVEVTGRVKRLAADVRDVGANRGRRVRVAVLGNDEVAELAVAFNDLLGESDAAMENLKTTNEKLKDSFAQLADTQRRLVDASRLSGMAEVATAVLHNVGNVLNSVNVSSNVVSDTVRRSRAAGVKRLADLLSEQEIVSCLSVNPKAQQIPNYVRQLGDALMQEHARVLEEMEGLQRNIEHIKVIVSTQQAHARGGGALERLELASLVEDAFTMNSGPLVAGGIEVVKDFQTVPAMLVERHKVVQILTNLMTNARHAIRDTGGKGRITLRIRSDADSAFLEVVDTGCGISPENLTKVFGHGFTTKRDGHGFGLHSSANAATEMGGRLSCSSDGPGRGATFILRLPLKRNRVFAAA